MGLAARAAAATTTFALLAGGGYLVADTFDLVPGFLTNAPVAAPPAPFPTAPGARLGPELTSGLSRLAADAPVPSATSVEDLVADLAKAEEYVGERVGVLVTDATTGQGIAGRAATTDFVPASTQKLLTAAAALSKIGSDRTLDTTAYLHGTTVTLVGGGDMLLAEGAGDPAKVNGRAGLADLAHQVAVAVDAAGLDAVTVRVDDSLFSGPSVAPSWDTDNIEAGYAAPVTALAVDVARRSAGTYAPRFADPSLAAGRDFAAALGKAGITVAGTTARGVPAEGASEVGRVSSAPMSEVVGYFLQTSDNTITEVVARMVAVEAGLPGSVQGATTAVLDAVAALDVDLTGAKLTDASGLGEGSRLSPRLLNELLLRMVDPAMPALREAALQMPLAGVSGTLHERFTTTDARGRVRAKTGSLPNVSSLAGTLVTADGRLLVFAVLVDDFPDDNAWNARATIDKFVSRVAACGCG
ncbi:D-alanyl-D-alanine carboxypeptidase/D-alanyl-D-alanine endopeptidase [Sanguibacter sp. A247]|uniref:D-alanyl-D-alanine carboxypeptidase/D-alanyl-D-alanine endopeptidase n=1 Tax=unclassified Sanguibacter TaxID=2645534 RepID=UPI003FD8BABD